MLNRFEAFILRIFKILITTWKMIENVQYFQYILSSTDKSASCYQNSSEWRDRLDSRLTLTPIHDATTQPRANLRQWRKFKRLWITIVFVYIYPLNGSRELDSYEEPCITLMATHLLPSLESSYIYINIYNSRLVRCNMDAKHCVL